MKAICAGEGAPGAAPEPWIDTVGLADYLAKPVSWVRDNVLKLGIPHRKLGKQYRYRLSQIDEWMSGARS